MYLLGYIPAHNRIYVCDKDVNIHAYSLSMSVIEYQSAVLRGDLETAEKLLPNIAGDQRNKIARFLEAQGGPILATNADGQLMTLIIPRYEGACIASNY